MEMWINGLITATLSSCSLLLSPYPQCLPTELLSKRTRCFRLGRASHWFTVPGVSPIDPSNLELITELAPAMAQIRASPSTLIGSRSISLMPQSSGSPSLACLRLCLVLETIT